MAGAPASSILVVDDDRLTLSMLSLLLTDAGYAVECAPNSWAALKAIERSSPDLVLVDIAMEPVDGYALLHVLRERWGTSLRIVALTGRPEINNSRREGSMFDGWIRKPFEVGDFLSRVSQHLAQAKVA